LREQGTSIVIATYDERMRTIAAGMGLELYAGVADE
jgi:hypothetical protein